MTVPAFALTEIDNIYKSNRVIDSFVVRDREISSIANSLSMTSHPRLPIIMPRTKSNRKKGTFFLFKTMANIAFCTAQCDRGSLNAWEQIHRSEHRMGIPDII